MGIEGKLLVSRKNIVVSKESIGIDNDLTKDRNMNTFKTYCKRRKSGARFPDRKANNRLCACHCIAGNDNWRHGPNHGGESYSEFSKFDFLAGLRRRSTPWWKCTCLWMPPRRPMGAVCMLSPMV